jgi:hypothetical protein
MNMNSLFYNNYQDRSNGMMGYTKKGFLPLQQTESLYGMALYDFETIANDVGLPAAPMHPSFQTAHPPVFHPVDEYKDLSLKEILDLSDDFMGPAVEDDQLLGNLEPVPFPPGYSGATLNAAANAQPVEIISSFDHSSEFNQISPSSSPFNPKKRSRSEDDDDCSSLSSEQDRERRFRPYQAGQWSEKFAELCEYREKAGHCLVPHTYKANLALARWVKRQRYQYKLMIEGKASTMTAERVAALEEIGFVWDSQGAAWGDRLGELAQFKETYMHCNVPSNFAENPRLATWIKCQRRQYKLYMEGKPSNMTPQRISHLEKLGFEWELRSYKKARSTSSSTV